MGTYLNLLKINYLINKTKKDGLLNEIAILRRRTDRELHHSICVLFYIILRI